MSIDNTQHLSKLSHEEIKTVHQQWPNPLTPLAFMLGGLIALGYGLMTFNETSEGIGRLIGGASAFIILTLGACIFSFVKVSKARKTLNIYAEQHELPQKELLKEFKKNLKHMKALQNYNAKFLLVTQNE